MPQVLVVDDSALDRVLVQGLLKKDPRLKVREAKSGVEALSAMSEAQPDIVVTDLQMPEMDGLQLVTAVRLRYPRVPVVLITAHGSEELAVRALEQGASSYVPKSQLAANLLGVVDQVLELAQDNRGYEALAQALEYAEFRFCTENDFAMTDRLVELAQQLAGSIGVCDTGSQVRLGMALEEAFRLTILRGNLELTPESFLVASSHSEEARAWIEERRTKPPFRERRIRVHMQVSADEARFEVTHQGAPLKLAERPPADGFPALEDPTERMLILMRAFMDEVVFHPGGMALTLIKRKSNA